MNQVRRDENPLFHKPYRILLLVARIWSLLSIGFVLMFVFGEAFNGQGSLPTAVEWIGLAFFPIGVLIGLVVAWWHPGLGGIITTFSLLAFYVWEFVYSGDLAGKSYFFLLAAPGLLFLIYWWLSERAINQ